MTSMLPIHVGRNREAIFHVARSLSTVNSAISKKDWSPATYLKFEDERTRPARDLLKGIGVVTDRKKIVDVGCGPGNSTELLVQHYPNASITGIDNSPGMLKEAKKRLPNIEFLIADANKWVPSPDVDLVFANASYQWVQEHVSQLKNVMTELEPGAILAVQMPDNVNEDTHRLMTVVANQGPWKSLLTSAARNPLPPVEKYYETLSPIASRVHIWRTTYYHVLKGGASSIVEFVKSTGLKPFLDPLSIDEQEQFISIYTEMIKKSYPTLSDGTSVLLPYPRLFIVAEK